MSYASLTDLMERAGEAEIRQIADRDRDGIPDADVIDAALTAAGNTIDGYVGTRHTLPLPSVPPVLTTLEVSIARYLLHRNGAPEHVVQDYKDAIATLKDVAAGRYMLPVAAGSTAAPVETGRVLASHPDQVFTADRLRGW